MTSSLLPTLSTFGKQNEQKNHCTFIYNYLRDYQKHNKIPFYIGRDGLIGRGGLLIWLVYI